MVYARHVPPPYIYMEYTWYTPTTYLVGVPDDMHTGTSVASQSRALIKLPIPNKFVAAVNVGCFAFKRVSVSVFV